MATASASGPGSSGTRRPARASRWRKPSSASTSRLGGGLDEESYTRITYTYAVDAAKLLAGIHPGLRFCFVSGEGADGGAMWARVKKRTEDALRAMPDLESVALRPGGIRASHGAELRGWLYKVGYVVMLPLFPLARRFGMATSGAEIGRAMLGIARGSTDAAVLDSGAINRLAAGAK